MLPGDTSCHVAKDKRLYVESNVLQFGAVLAMVFFLKSGLLKLALFPRLCSWKFWTQIQYINQMRSEAEGEVSEGIVLFEMRSGSPWLRPCPFSSYFQC